VSEKKLTDSTTIALPNKTFKALLFVEHELEIERMATVSHGDTIDFLVEEYNKRR
jgi:hypothetical protein